MSFSVNELRSIGRTAGLESKIVQNEKGVYAGAVAIQWAAAVVFLVMLAITVSSAIGLIHFQVAGVGKIKIVAVLITATLGLGYSLVAVRIQPPDGLAVTRESAPDLWAEVDAICRKISVAVPKGIILDDRNNAAAATVPRFGLLPLSDTYLVLGVPLLIALTPDQGRSIIAHEMGHFSKQHSRSTLQVYRALTIVRHICGHASESGNFVLGILARAYAFAGGLLNRAAMSLSRQHEFQADRIAGEVVGRGVAAQSLVMLAIADAVIGRNFRLLADERTLIERGRPQDKAQATLDIALAEPDSADSTHPSLRARIAALGQEPVLPALAGAHHAASAWFPNLDQIVAKFDAERSKALAAGDEHQAEFRAAAAKRLETLTGAPAPAQTTTLAGSSRLGLEAMLDNVRDAIAVKDLDLAETLANSALSHGTALARAHLNLGIIGVIRDQPHCLDELLNAARLDLRMLPLAAANVDIFINDHPTTPGALDCRQKIRALAADAEKAGEERYAENLFGTLGAADLSADARATILQALGSDPNIRAAALARRRVTLWPGLPAYSLCIRIRHGWEGSSPAQEAAATQRLEAVVGIIELFGTVAVTYPTQLREHIAAWRIGRTKGALVYAAPG